MKKKEAGSGSLTVIKNMRRIGLTIASLLTGLVLALALMNWPVRPAVPAAAQVTEGYPRLFAQYLVT